MHQMTQALATEQFVQIGKRRFPLKSYQQASEAYSAMIAKTGVGSSRAPRADIVDHRGHVVAHISYNGRVWPGTRQEWHPEIKPLYDNR